ncbi:MAG TPA: zinc-ribbon domain-containing protein [Candidatus Binatia bacterium]|nr:zinc-ribbon domain-containing protein [Candidatus Binatia bacterium]
MSTFCPQCAASMPDNASFCPGCGRAMRGERADGKVGALPVNLAGALAYFTLIPAVIFLLVEPYKHNRFVRFHSFQCLGLWLASAMIGAVVRIASFVLGFVPIIGHLLVWLIGMVVSLAFVIAWVVLVVKALQGEMFQLPVIGEFADKQA